MATEYTTNGIPFLRSQNILPFQLELSSIKYISPEFHKKLKKSALYPRDVVVVRTGYPGTACVIPSNFPVSNCADLVIIRPSSQLNSYYLAYVFNSAWGRSHVSGNLVGVAQQHFNIGVAKEMVIHLPPFSIQNKIAAILSAYDDLIENNTRRIAILEEMAQSLYREWFVHFRFPGHEKKVMVESALGMIPEGWEVKTLGNLGATITGKTPSKLVPANFNEEYMPFIKTPDMHNNIFCVQTEEYLSRRGALSQKNKTIPPNSLCVSCIGTAGVVSITSVPAQTNQQINSIVLNDEFNRELLYFVLNDLKETINRYGSNGVTMVNLNKGKFEALKVIFPDKSIVVDFHKLTYPMFEEIRSLQMKNLNLRCTRDLLLPKLIVGEVDVEGLEIAGVEDTGEVERKAVEV